MIQPLGKNRLDLRRQAIFLRTFDQKIAGLRRENERLERLIANPKIRFSRSSLGGLYRIVNSLLSAGPMYGLSDIEAWAKKTRDWTVEMGKRKSKPTKDDLNWLLGAIAELGDLRDQAMNDIREGEAALKAEAEKRLTTRGVAKEALAEEERVPEPAVNEKSGLVFETARQAGPKEQPEDLAGDLSGNDATGTGDGTGRPAGGAESRWSADGLRSDSPWDDIEEEELRESDPILQPPRNKPPMVEPILPPRRPTKRESGDTNAALLVRDSKDTQSFGLLPFQDEPQKSSVREISFGDADDEGARKKGKRRDTTTIPLALEDLHEVSPAEPPPLFAAHRRSVSSVWRTIAVACIIAFAFLAGFQVHMFILGGPEGVPYSKTPHTAATDLTADPAPAPVTSKPPVPEESSPSSPETTPETPELQAASGETGAAADAPPEGEETPQEKPKEAAVPKASKRNETAERKRARNRAKRQHEREDAKRARETKREPEATGEVGTLVVKAPAENVPVFVLVDGVSRGKAPIRVKLKPGIHEVVFSADGRRAMRMVPIREDKTKTIDAKIP